MPRKATLIETAPSPFKGVKMKTIREFFWNFGKEEFTSYPLTEAVPGYGFKKGDIITSSPVTELKEDELYLWHHKTDKGFIAGFCYWNFGDFYVGGKLVDPTQWICTGKVSSIYRSYDVTDYLPDYIRESSELSSEQNNDREVITVTCRGCQKQLTGSRFFLTGMAWRIKPEYSECPSCR